MRFNLYILVIITYSSVISVLSSDQGSKNTSVFVPTNEWQVVKKGTPIPKGLHVRHNFQTGITEAKLIQPEDTSSRNDDEMPKSLALHPDAAAELTENNVDLKFEQDDKSVKISAQELKAKLKKIKSSKTASASKDEHPHVSDKKTSFHSHDKLKEEFGNMSFGKSADVDLLGGFIDRFNTHRNAIISGSLSAEEVKVVMDILSQLEYLVHDIDNGLEFTRSGGLVKVIYPCLNGTIEEIKYEALRVLGAAVQSNPKVKEAALELEFVPSILRTLTKYENSKLMDRCIYALGSLVRHYPAAQKVFLSHGGLEIFSQVLTEGPVSTQKRIMNLINDLIVERQELNEIEDLQNRKLKTEEYADVELEEKIVRHKFCTQLGSLLVKTTETEMKTEFDHRDGDLLEAIYECALTSGDICKFEFRQSENRILYALNEISSFYKSLDLELYSDENDLISHMLTLISRIKETIFEKSHDEL